MVSGADTPNRTQAVANHDLCGQRQIDPRVAQRRIFDEELVRAVVGVKIVGQVAQIMHQRVRARAAGRIGERFRERAICA